MFTSLCPGSRKSLRLPASLIRTAPALALAFLSCALIKNVYGQGQTAFASVSGQIHDPSGAAVVGANVILSNSDIGIRRTFTSDSGGRYFFTQLAPGTYSLNVSQPGFTTYIQ